MLLAAPGASWASLVVQRKLDNGSFETLTQNTHYNILSGGGIQMLQASVTVPTGNTATLRIYRTDPDNEEAMSYLEHRLTRIGVIRALTDAGFEPGDDVEIGGVFFELDPGGAIGDP